MADEVQSLTQEMCRHIHFQKMEFMWLYLQGLCAGLNREGMGISDHVFCIKYLQLAFFCMQAAGRVVTLCNINTDLLTQIIKRT